MDNIPITRAYLETLSTEELYGKADLYGVDTASGMDRELIIEDLLEIAVSDTEAEEEIVEEKRTRVHESVDLPKQYNITFIETIVRDPLWAFVFWEVKVAEREIFENASDFAGYYLKVSPWGQNAPAEGGFTVPLAPEDSTRYLGFPPAGEKGDFRDRCYKVELCAERGGEEILLAATNPFRLPSLAPRIDKQENPGLGKYPLIQLSGAEEFHILRNGDREARIKR